MEALGIDVIISLFADDFKIAVAINSIDDTLKLQRAIDRLKTWCDANDLHLNLSKCSVMSITNKQAANIIIGNYHYENHKIQVLTVVKSAD